MSALDDFIDSYLQWFIINLWNILYSIVAIVVVYVFYRFSTRQVERLDRDGWMDEAASFIVIRILKWGSMLAVVAFTIAQFGIRVDLLAGLFVLAGGTVIGFAAMNTLGNAIAGFILMLSRSFKIGDRIFFDGRFDDVETIDLIYTKMTTTDDTIISIPNQKLIQTEVEDYGKARAVKRRYNVTAGYVEAPEKVEAVLLEAAGQVEGVLGDPAPYVWITEFQSFAVEYTLFVYISDLKSILRIDSAVRKAIFEACDRHGIDLSTPTLLRSMKS
ncbi:MAG: mechanosensitive ion channel [Candidatus Bathyarchaeota archaeon]|nr:MAG: mechanosensitive ion channel [Candidatus Bathyarchaeota archaeon]